MKAPRDLSFDVSMNPQPCDTSCGPTCLHGIYDYLGRHVEHQELIDAIPTTQGGGRLGVQLAIDAIQRGFQVRIYSHNLTVFDPTWFSLPQSEAAARLRLQASLKPDPKTQEASLLYAEFIDRGGKILFEDLTPSFLRKLLMRSGPVICGLSATYFYRTMRERDENCADDDVGGYPQGHFVVLSGINGRQTEVLVTDPYETNPLVENQKYRVSTLHFINSILIGVITYDANLLVITKPK